MKEQKFENPFFSKEHPLLRKQANNYLSAHFHTICAEDRADIISEIFLKLWLEVETLTLTCPPICYLKVICKRRAIDFLRRRRSDFCEFSPQTIPLSIANDETDWCAYNFDYQIVKAVETLPQRRRLLIEEKYLAKAIAGLSLTERQNYRNHNRLSDNDFAAEWGISAVAVRQERHRGINQLRTIFGQIA